MRASGNSVLSARSDSSNTATGLIDCSDAATAVSEDSGSDSKHSAVSGAAYRH
jgi:hypothetical protein